MAQTTTHSVAYRRKREQKTNYKRRLSLLKGRKTRLVVRKSNQRITLQLVDYEAKGDKVLFHAHSGELTSKGWPVCNANIPEAYLTGLLLANKAKGKVSEVVVDIGRQYSVHGSRLYAAIKGAIDGGLNIPCDEKVFPPEERISGKHISEYAKKLADDKAAYEKAFSRYLKANVDPTRIDELVSNVKANIGA